MSQKRQTDRDRLQAEEDYRTNVAAKDEIETILRELSGWRSISSTTSWHIGIAQPPPRGDPDARALGFRLAMP